MKARLFWFLICALALVRVPDLQAQTNLANGLDNTDLVWTTGGTGGIGWFYEAELGGGTTFDGIDSAKSGHVGNNGETWLQATVVGPGTISFWWKAFSEPYCDWLEFYIGSTLQASISGADSGGYSIPSDWEYCSFQVPAGTNVLRWRYVKDYDSTGGTYDCGWVDQVSYVTSPPPPLEQALNTSGVEWSSSGSVYDNGWFAQTNITHDGQWAAQSGAVWHNQTNWLQATVSGVTNLGFWWKVSSEAGYDFLEFYTNGVLAKQISGEVNWQSNFFRFPFTTNILTWVYRKNDTGTAGSNCGWLDQVTFSTPIPKADTTTAVTVASNPSVFGQAVTFTATVTVAPPASGTPTGTVTFKDGPTTLGTSSLSAGQATFTTASLLAGSHPITATYNGDIFFKISDSSASPLTQVVNQASTTTTVASLVNPSVFGQPASFTVTVNAVAPGAGTPTGTVQFSIDGLALGVPVTLSEGMATSDAIASLLVAGHSVTAAYSGDTSFAGSDNSSSPFTQTVNAASTATTVASSANPSVFGQSVTFTATVAPLAPGSGTPSGTVTFQDGAATLGTGTLSGGVATFSTSALSVASHSITAVYGGDSRFNPSTSSTLAQTVNKDATTTTLASSANPSVFNQAVTFTANVTANSPGGGTPTGSVTFKDGTTALGTAVLSTGQAAFTTSTLSVAAHSVTAVYNGDANLAASTNSPSLTQTVNKAASSVALNASANPTVFGQPVIFTVSVSAVAPASGTPTGTVTFKDGATPLATNTLVSGQASYTNATLAVAAHGMTAVYNGDGNFANNTSGVLTQNVNRASTTTTLASSVNPSVFGQAVTFTATVSAVAPGAGTRTGTVQFSIDGSPLGSPVTISGGTAISSAISLLAVTGHTVTAVYSGDSSFAGSDNTSAPLTQTVNVGGTTTTLAASANPSVFGQAVSFTATVAAVAPASGTPTGTIQFRTNGVNFGGLATLSAGAAISPAFSSSAAGNYTVTADYSGDGGFNTSSATLAGGQTVNKANSSTAVSSSVNPCAFGQPVTFSATVTAVSPGTGTPSGTVQFKTNGVNCGSAVTLSGGSASSIALSSLGVGSCAVTVDYSGDGSFNASSGNLVGGQTVNKANSSTVVSSSVNPSAFGQPVTFNAVVTAVSPGTGTPTGTVQFKTNGVNLGAAVTLSGGSASSPAISSLAAGATTVTAVYSGDASFNASTSSALTQAVNKADTSIAVFASGNPSVFGQAVTFTATVAPISPGAGTPTGTVQFKTNGVNCGGAVTLSGGSATSPAISALPVGNSTVTAVYSGDASFNTSTGSLAGGQAVNKADSSTAVASSANPSVWGQTVTFAATVTAVAPGTGTPTGTVQFKTNGVDFGSAVTLAGGSASSPTLSSLAIGTITVTAIYVGDSSFNGSGNATAPLSQTVNKASTTTTIVASANPSSLGDPVSWTATVTASAPGSGIPTGTVQFKIDGTDFAGPLALSGGSATSIAISTLASGSHLITAVYSGDSHFNNGSSADFTQTVNTGLVTPATGGEAISADTTGETFTSLTGPAYTEPSLGAVGTGTIILNAPAGFVFDTGGTAPTVQIIGGASSAKNINDAESGTALAMTAVTATQLTFTVTASSSGGGTPNTLIWQDVRVRPVAGTPLATGRITRTGTSTMSGVTNGANFGFLAEAAGAASRLAVQIQPSATATAGTAFAQQPAIQIQDQFGNARTYANRNADNATVVTAARGAGTGILQGTLTAKAANGLAAFSNLFYQKAETISIQFTSGSVTSATSGNVVVSPADADRLVFATQPGSVTYGSALSPEPVVKTRDAFGNDSTVGLAASLPVTLSLSAGTGSLQGTTSLDIGTSAANGTVTFSGLQVTAAGTGKQLTAAAAGLASAVSGSFTIYLPALPAIIHELARQPDGNMEIKALGTPNHVCLIQACQNLGSSWMTIGTNSADAGGIIVFLDQSATNYASRFYRLVTPE